MSARSPKPRSPKPRSPKPRESGKPRRRSPKVGVWLFGARGGLATTVLTGARATARGLAEPIGLMTESPACAELALAPLDTLVFGGHEVRDGSSSEAAREIHEANGTIPFPLLKALARDYAAFDKNVRQGTIANSGATIRRITGAEEDGTSLRAQVERLADDLREFRQRHRLDRLVCVNLTSTEPKLRLTRTHGSLAAFDRALDADRRTAVRPSTLYAYAAASVGAGFVHFTPSDATLIPAIRELFEQNGAAYMGCDGKTGETLVKSALAPMFRYRNLRVLSWQGYNILGDRDGAVLADGENKASKVESKDHLLQSILGYPLHSHVGIDYVPSLDDLKTAWDFIHFQGFLGFRMSMQFTWQGADAILAAPLVLDMVRFAELAARRGEAGPMKHLACFFKSPLDVEEHDLHAQWHKLSAYLAAATPTE